MRRILLLNPPGKKLYLRDYYCSKVSQAEYINPPIDLLLLSGRLQKTYKVDMIDAIVERLSIKDVLGKIQAKNYDVIIILVGSVSWEEDKIIINKIKNKKDTLVIASGDLLLQNSKKRMEEAAGLDAVLLDFASNDIVYFLEGKFDKIRNMLYRHNGKIIESELIREKNTFFELPVPKHDLFINKNYRHPFTRSKSFSAILTDFGCPFKCTFCIMPTLGFKYRTVNNVIEEIHYISSLGIKELFWADQTFGVTKDRNKNICQRIIDENVTINWFTFSRVDVIDFEMLELMKKAGCHTIIFGVESANEEILRKCQKGYTKRQIIQAFEWCDKLGINTVATFILGLPEETKETCLETIKFAKKIKCDFASFNVAVPRIGTKLRENAIKSGLVNNGFTVMDQSGTVVAMPTKNLSIKEIKKLKRKAVFEFYLRLSYLARRVNKIDSFFQLKTQIRNAVALLRNFF